MLPFRKQDKEKRREYRVDTAGKGAIHLRTEDGPVVAEILDISAHGCGARVAESKAGSLVTGASLSIQVRLDEGPQKLFLKGRIRNVVATQDGRVRIGIEFEEAGRLIPQLRAEQWRFFNRRSAYRVPPKDLTLEPMRVQLTGRGDAPSMTLALLDLSECGVATLLPVRSERVEPGMRFTGRVELENDSGALEVALVVVHRTARPDGARLGMEIEEVGDVLVNAEQQAIGEWVVERQRQLLARD